MGNYSFKAPPESENGATISGHNLTQGAPHTPIYAGVTGLRFQACNLLNCDVPVDAVVVDCLVCHVSFCSHLHPEWLAKGYIAECAEDCQHRTEVDIILIDGIMVDSNSSYEDKVAA